MINGKAPDGKWTAADIKRATKDVTFEIAVTREQTAKGGAGVKLHVVNLGADAKAVKGSVKLKFDIPIIYPTKPMN